MGENYWNGHIMAGFEIFFFQSHLIIIFTATNFDDQDEMILKRPPLIFRFKL